MNTNPTRTPNHRPAVAIVHDRFERWIIALCPDLDRAWSGSRWVPIDRNGLPASSVQVSNWTTFSEAHQRAIQEGFNVLVLDAHPLAELTA